MTTQLGRHEKYIARAAEAANLLSDCRFRLGSVVVKSGKVLSVAANRWRNTEPIPGQPLHYMSIDAEVGALKQVPNPEGATIYVTRVGRTGNLTMARPCIRCQLEIVQAKVKTLVFTDWDGKICIERVSCLV